MKGKVHLLSIVGTLICALLMPINAIAEEPTTPNLSNQSVVSDASLMMKSISVFASDFGQDFDQYDLSDTQLLMGIPVYRTEDGQNFIFNNLTYYPLAYENNVIGVFRSHSADESAGSLTFDVAYIKLIDEMSKLNTALAYLKYGDTSYLIGDNLVATVNNLTEEYQIDQDASANKIVNQFRLTCLPENNANQIIADPLQVDFSPIDNPISAIKNKSMMAAAINNGYTANVTALNASLGVPIQNQFKSLYPQTQGGLCWAASSACIGNYMTGRAWSAKTVADKLGIGYDDGGWPKDMDDAVYMYTYSNGTNLSNAVTIGAPLDITIKNCICNGIPILADLDNINGGAGHAVTVRGYDTSSGDLVLNVMNSGYNKAGGFQVMRRPSSSSYFEIPYADSTFVWTGSNLILNYWQKPFGQSSWSYFDNYGRRATGWHQIGTTWYNFTSGGYMNTGWVQSNGNWFYLDSSGAMLTGWQQISGTWYYFASSGEMQTSWVKISGKYYYFNNSGALQVGWVSYGGEWYYCNPSHDGSYGAMQTGWLNDSGTWYYLRPALNTPVQGSMGAAIQSNSAYIGGKTYLFDSSGACTNP